MAMCLLTSLTYFGEVLHCPHFASSLQRKCTSQETLVTFETLKWKYTFATNVLNVTRDESPLVYRAPESASEHSHFGTCLIGTSTIRECRPALFQVTKYRQFVRKVGTSATSALIRYYLPRLKLSSSTHDGKWTNV